MKIIKQKALMILTHTLGWTRTHNPDVTWDHRVFGSFNIRQTLAGVNRS